MSATESSAAAADAGTGAGEMDAAVAAVRGHVARECGVTYREPSGILRFKYLVPAGPYNQCWDWDASHMGVGLLRFGGAPYLAGSMLNFLDHVCARLLACCLGWICGTWGSLPHNLLLAVRWACPQTDATTGEVRGCMMPTGYSKTIYHAKPVIIQGAWLSCQNDAGAIAEFLALKPKMEALLACAAVLCSCSALCVA